MINAMLADAAVAISVALQHGVSAQALAKSVGRLPESRVTPANLDQGPSARLPVSPIGAVLDLLRSFENGSARVKKIGVSLAFASRLPGRPEMALR